MKLSRLYSQCLLLTISFFAVNSFALDKAPYDEALFNQLQEDGNVVLIDVYASWCPTCAKQQEIISSYQKNNPSRKLHILEVDYDKDKDLVRHFRAPRQSTLLIYKGHQQFWFSVAETREAIVHAELNKAFEFEPK